MNIVQEYTENKKKNSTQMFNKTINFTFTKQRQISISMFNIWSIYCTLFPSATVYTKAKIDILLASVDPIAVRKFTAWIINHTASLPPRFQLLQPGASIPLTPMTQTLPPLSFPPPSPFAPSPLPFSSLPFPFPIPLFPFPTPSFPSFPPEIGKGSGGAL